jgi:tRNA-2-methylthio-N6-dimethylallyladenosine synthase
MKKIFLETFGCQMNVLDSELVENQLRVLGYDFTPLFDEADVVLYNTCSVREKSEQKVWSRLGTLKERKAADPSLVIGVIGCMAERDGVSLMKRMPQVDLMCGPSELDQLPALLDNVLKTGKQQHALAGTGRGNAARRSQTIERAAEGDDGLELLDLSRSFSATEHKFQAYIRIVRGCNKFCTYCVVPYTRGAEVSRTPQAILEEARKLTAAGCREITLLGQTVNHYVYETDTRASTAAGPVRRRTTFAELLSLLHDNLPDLPRLRFITSFPADFGDDILRVMAESPRICRYLHIPAQSGSNRILKMMNRGYTVESYLELVARARAIVPNIQLAGDIIVGFPSETDEDYAATRALVEKARYKNCFIFKYSPRPGTLAIKRLTDDIPEETKRFRNNDLLRLQNKISNELNRELIGQTVSILCEGPSGWNGGDAGDSVIAGAKASGADSCFHSSSSASGTIEFGPRLAAALKPAAIQDQNPRRDRHGQTWKPPLPSTPTAPGSIQLTGRTQHDQIVVFNGPPALAGEILEVRIRDARGLTIFADLMDNRIPDPALS